VKTMYANLRGCPLSVIFLNALLSLWYRALQHEVPEIGPAAFVDDTAVTGTRFGTLQKAADLTCEFADAMVQIINVTKTVFFNTSRRRVKNLSTRVSSYTESLVGIALARA
jgi:hypothetical protein